MPKAKSPSPPPDIEAKLRHKEPCVIAEDVDDAVVVNVSGHGSKYKIPRPSSQTISCNGTVRQQLVTAIIVNLVLFIICLAYGCYASFVSLEQGDDDICIEETNRLVYQLTTHTYHLNKLTSAVAQSDSLYSALRDAENGNLGAIENAVEKFFFTKNHVWDTSMDINLLTVFYSNLSVAETWYYPSSVPGKQQRDERAFIDTTNWREVLSTKRSSENPVISKKLIEHFGTQAKWANIVPAMDTGDLFIYAFSPVTPQNGTGPSNGFVAVGRLLEGKLRSSAEGISACVTSYMTAEDESTMEESDKEAFRKTSPRTLNSAAPKNLSTVVHETSCLDDNRNRFCPGSMSLLQGDTSVACFAKIEDPSLTGILSGSGSLHGRYSFRIDIPNVIHSRGKVTSAAVSAASVFFFGAFLIAFEEYITRTVLKRINALSVVIKEQTQETEANRYFDISDAYSSDAMELSVLHSGKGGEAGGKKQVGSEASSTTSSHSTSSGSSSSVPFSRRNELTKLRSAMEENALALRDRMDKADEAVHAERTRYMRNKQTLQLLNMWLGRQDFFPGLKTNALQLRYEPTRGIDDLLDSPLAVEYLKVHCAEEKTLENLLFLLDVAWLKEVEIAAANAETSIQREQLSCVAENAAQTIIARYIAEGAPQPINISAETRAMFSEKDSNWHNVGMFDSAEREVRLMLDTDVLPRFRKTVAYTALSETLYFFRENGIGDSSASAMSDETVSTFGSIDTDEGTEAEDIGHNFAHAFTRLHIYNRDDIVTTAGTDSTGTSGSTTDESSRADASTDTSSIGKEDDGGDVETETSTATGDKKGSVATTEDDQNAEEKKKDDSEEEKEEKKSASKTEESKQSSQSGSSKGSSSGGKDPVPEAEESGSESQKASSSASSSASSHSEQE